MEFLIYLGKVSIGLVALYALYWGALRWHTFFHFNRYYLLTATFLALVIPLITFKEQLTIPYQNPQPVSFSQSLTPATPLPTDEQAITWIHLLLMIYTVGCMVMLSRLVLKLRKIMTFIHQYDSTPAEGYTLVRMTDSPISSFSFGRYLVVNTSEMAHFDQSHLIIAHELVHIRQRHSWDLLWIEVLQVFFWFNPILIFYKRSLKAIHEFIADEQATQGDRYGYAIALASHALGVSPQVLTNSFFDVSLLKNRIAMLNKNRSSRLVLGRYLWALPVVGGMIALLASRQVEYVKVASQQKTAKIEDNTPSFSIQNQSITPKPAPKKAEQTVDQNAEFPGGTEELMKYLAKNIKYPAAASRNKVEGYVFVKFIIGKDGSVLRPTILKGLDFGCDEEALRVVQNMPKWKPGKSKGKAVDTEYTLPIQFKLAKKVGMTDPSNWRRESWGYEFMPRHQKNMQVGEKSELIEVIPGGNYLRFYHGNQVLNEPLIYILNGKEVKNADLRNFKPGEIIGLTYLSPEESVKVFGEQNKTGVAYITTKVVSNSPVEAQDSIYQVVETPPQFRGGAAGLQNFINENLQYPEPALKANVSGTVFLQFVVRRDGTVSDIHVLKGMGFGGDAEALRLLKLMDKWTPAKHNGQTVSCKYNLPIAFIHPNRKK